MKSKILVTDPPGSTLKFALGRKYEDLELIVSLLKEGDTYFDIGANYGYHALKVHDSFEKIKITCFEPENEAFRRLLQNRRINKAKWNCLSFGLGDVDYWTKISTELGGFNHITQDGTGQTMKVIRLDDFIEDNPVTQIDVLKIDVEGYEYFVLNGAKKTLEQKIIKNIVFEVDGHEQRYGIKTEDLEKLLTENNYRCLSNKVSNYQHWTIA